MILSEAEMSERLQDYGTRIEMLAKSIGLDYHPVDFELVPSSFMNEVAIYGLPIRMPHWSFGVRYIHQLIRQSMGHSRIFEVMFPGNPCHGYLVNNNTLAENTLVTAHVLGHADFAKNNHLFARFAEMSGTNIVEHAAAQAHRIEEAVKNRGLQRVETLLDAALALEPHVDLDQELHRPLYAKPPLQSREGHAVAGRSLHRAVQASARGRLARRSTQRAQEHADSAAPGIGPAVVYRALRPGARRLGARRISRRSPRVVLFLSGVRVQHHERGLGDLLARAAPARSGFSARGSLSRRRHVSLQRRTPVRRGAAGGPRDQSVSRRIFDVGTHRR